MKHIKKYLKFFESMNIESIEDILMDLKDLEFTIDVDKKGIIEIEKNDPLSNEDIECIGYSIDHLFSFLTESGFNDNKSAILCFMGNNVLLDIRLNQYYIYIYIYIYKVYDGRFKKGNGKMWQPLNTYLSIQNRQKLY